MEYKVGMIVKCVKGYYNNFDIVGKLGRIIEMHNNIELGEVMYIIQFNEHIEGGHSGFGHGKKGYCWNVPKCCIIPINSKEKN